MIEPPEAFIPLPVGTQRSATWAFKGYTEAALQRVWQEAGLAPADGVIQRHPRRAANATAIVIRPPPAAVTNLSPVAREKIHSALAAFPENPPSTSRFASAPIRSTTGL